jgi:hypothetical protein
MNAYPRFLATLLALLISLNAAAERDDKALSVLQSMSDYIGGMDSFTVDGTSMEDYRGDAGLIITSPNEVKVTLKRPNALRVRQFDGEATKDLYLNGNKLTVFDSATAFYATAKVPADLDGAMSYALNELAIDLPLMDLIHSDVFSQLVGKDEDVIYLGNKNRISGVDCHQVAIRLADADVQIWVQEGDKPLPRRMMITSKWEGGSPRFIADMQWQEEPDIAPGTFDFGAPEGASEIQFSPAD